MELETPAGMRQKNSSYFTTFDKKKKKKKKIPGNYPKGPGYNFDRKKKPFKENSPPLVCSVTDILSL